MPPSAAAIADAPSADAEATAQAGSAAPAADGDTAAPRGEVVAAPAGVAPARPVGAREPGSVAASRRTPSFAHTARRPVGRPKWRAIAAIAGLGLLLAVQVLMADRAALAADARWRPWVETLCGALRCTLPAWHEPTAFTLLSRDVRPARPGVLHVSTRFRNDARWPQAWPLLHLALQDVDGRTVAARTLAPAEYLGRAPFTQKRLATGQVVTVAFDVAEPSATVVAFTFDFR